MVKTEGLCAAILERLSRVIDPETGVDVVRMRLIEDLVVDENAGAGERRQQRVGSGEQ